MAPGSLYYCPRRLFLSPCGFDGLSPPYTLFFLWPVPDYLVSYSNTTAAARWVKAGSEESF
jgi:hypothetical protein